MPDVHGLPVGADAGGALADLVDGDDAVFDAAADGHPVLGPGALLPKLPYGLEPGVVADQYRALAAVCAEKLPYLGGDIKIQTVFSLTAQLVRLKAAAGGLDVVQMALLHPGGGGAVKHNDMVGGLEVFASLHSCVAYILKVNQKVHVEPSFCPSIPHRSPLVEENRKKGRKRGDFSQD